MLQYFAFLLIASNIAFAQLPTNASFRALTSYLPFISTNTGYIFNDTRARQQLASASSNPVTIFLTLNVPFAQFLASLPLSSPQAAQLETTSLVNPSLTSDILQYLQLDGLHPAEEFNGSSFLTTRFTDPVFENITENGVKGAVIEVFRNQTAFYIVTGIGFRSNVLIPNLAFNGGILHIVDHPAAPPYSLADTGIVLNISIISQIVAQPFQITPEINNASDITVFAVQNSVASELLPPNGSGDNTTARTLANYVVPGQVLYSTNLTDGFVTGGTVLPAGVDDASSGLPLVVSTSRSGSVLVNGSRILESDILIRNGVVHVIESTFVSRSPSPPPPPPPTEARSTPTG